MAAYAALVSVLHIIDHIKLHPSPLISLDQNTIDSLTENITFLKEFLEGYSHVAGYSKEADPTEMRIADAAYAAEDVIESHIVDRIHGDEIRSVDFHQDLQKVVENMDCIKKEVMQIVKEKTGIQDQLQRKSMVSSSSSSSSNMKNAMVGFDDVVLEIMDKLTNGQLDRRVIPIAGMGGIGKTTLARNVYENRAVMQHFDFLAWVTISQEYRMREILLELLQKGRGDSSGVDELGIKLHKQLSGRRYLIVLDDLWDFEVWDKLNLFFPDNNNGSRIMLTTRLSNLACRVRGSCGIEMSFLDDDDSWSLFSEIVFGEEGCPLQLEDIGKKIVKNCRGLPLSIVVIGGLLAKSECTLEYWEYIEGNLSSIVNSEDNERCLKILHISYNQLPVYLKPCFLYMGVFEEDRVVTVSTLVKLWVAEGFLKPISGMSLEEVAREYLKELVDRNLILVHKLGSTGNIKFCRIHDLLRDLCLRQARKDKFYDVVGQGSINLPQSENTERRVVIPESASKEKVVDSLQSMSLARSFICDFQGNLPSLDFKLLRILKTIDEYSWLKFNDSYFPENMFVLVNSRYLAIAVDSDSKFASSICLLWNLLWNLQTLIVDCYQVLTAPTEIWNMSQLRHANFSGGLSLPDPSAPTIEGRDDIVLENIQTLSHVRDFKFSEVVVKRIPNIKKLKLSYHVELDEGSSYYPNNLNRLHKLESLYCAFWLSGTFLQNLTFPHSLKKLSLEAGHSFLWEDAMGHIGSLPLLEKLKLCQGSYGASYKWETMEGQFHSLKFLEIGRLSEFHGPNCMPLVHWITESSHFPRLEHLVLQNLSFLEEIPLDIGEIPTLKSIELDHCSYSAAISAKDISEKHKELGEVGLRVRVIFDGEMRSTKLKRLERFVSPSFQVEWEY